MKVILLSVAVMGCLSLGVALRAEECNVCTEQCESGDPAFVAPDKRDRAGLEVARRAAREKAPAHTGSARPIDAAAAVPARR